MRRLTYLLLLTLLFFLTTIEKGVAQTVPSTSDCPGAVSVCQNVYVETRAPLDSGKQELNDVNNDCLATYENYTTWYIINVVKDGNLAFVITPPTPVDYDFAVYDLTGDKGSKCRPSSCNLIKDTPPVRCNYSGSPQPTGLSNTLTGPFEAELPVKAGETYAIVIDNYSGRSGQTVGYTIDFSASTASIFDTAAPSFSSVGTRCNYESNMITVEMSELIQCNSISPDGSDFSISPNTGNLKPIAASSIFCKDGRFTTSIDLQFSNVLAPGTYTLSIKKGNDGNTLFDNCGNPQDLADQIQFTIAENPNPFVIKSIDYPACRYTRVVTSHEIRCNTIAPDGSDFKLSGPDTSVRVISAIPIGCKERNVECSTEVVADTIDLLYNKSIGIPGLYTISVQNGTDTNALLDTCGGTIIRPFEYEVKDDHLGGEASKYYLCQPGYVYIDANIKVKPSPDGYHLKWQPSLFVLDTTAENTQVFVPRTSTYTVQIIDSAYCYQRDTITVEVSTLRAETASVTDTSICVGGEVLLRATGGAWYHWFPEEGLSCARCDAPAARPIKSTKYYVRVADPHDCADTLSYYINVDQVPDTRILTSDTVIRYGQSVQLLAAGARQYNWMPAGSLSTPNTSSPIATPVEPTTYVVTGISNKGCRSFDTVKVDIDYRDNIFVPTGFSPNGDGKNDVFRIANMTFQRLMEFRVFNRWGQEIFSTNNAKGGWDGTWKGEPQPIGTYKYIIRIGFPDGIVETYQGDVTLIR